MPVYNMRKNRFSTKLDKTSTTIGTYHTGSSSKPDIPLTTLHTHTII